MKMLIFVFSFFLVLFSCQKRSESSQITLAQADSSSVEKAGKTVENIALIEDELIEIEKICLDTLPLIESSLAKELAPKMKKWLSVYNLDISEFRAFGKELSFDWDAYKDQGAVHHQEFVDKEDDIYLPAFHSYSPSKRLYVNLIESQGVGLINDTLNYYGRDDCQEIYLTNRDMKKKVMILWLENSTTMEDCFWIDSHRFVLVGFAWTYPILAEVHLFDIRNLKSRSYLLYVDESVVGHIDYFGDHNLDSKGLPLKIE